MKTCFALAALLGFFSAVHAQAGCSSAAAAVPSCGQSCLTSAQSAIGCGATDYACGCSKSAELQSSALNCVISACGVATALQVSSSAQAICSCVATAGPGSSATPTPTPTPSATPEPSSSSAEAGSSVVSSAPASTSAGQSESSSPSTISSALPSSGGACGEEVVTVTVTVTDSYLYDA